MTISVGPPATPTFAAVTPICSGNPLAALPSTSINGFTGTWSPAINNTATTLYTFNPTAGQCALTAGLTISVNPLPLVNAGLDQTICAGATVSLNGSGASTYSWNNGITNGTAFTPAATATYTVSGTDANGCINTDQIDVFVNAAPIVNAGPDASICTGGSATLTANGATTYSWSPGAQTTTSINVSPLGNTTYIVTGTNANGCSSSDQVNVLIIPLPTVLAGLDQTICAGSTVTLSGSGASTYSWNNGITNGVAFQPSSTATYTVTGTTIEGCENTDDVTIIVNQTLPVTFTADVTNGCAPLTVTLTNTTANSSDCNWVFSNGTTLNGCGSITTTFTQAGCYDVTLNTLFVNGCNGSQTATDLICVENAPDASFNQSANTISEFDPFIDFTNTSIGANSYSWNFGDNSALSSEVNPSHDYSDSPEGLFQVMLIAYSTNGCADTAYSNFQFNEELIFYVPNTFTPDGDIFNQEFLPIFSSGYDPYDYNLAIYNRWGEIIFESNNSEIGWDGSYGTNGEIVMSQDGTYTWKITFKTIRNDERKFVVGHVNLVR
jgi:gliding motility-associated-like protein